MMLNFLNREDGSHDGSRAQDASDVAIGSLLNRIHGGWIVNGAVDKDERQTISRELGIVG